MKQAPEIFRLTKHPSDSSFGNNGMFVIPHYKIDGYYINCLVSDGMGWDHVSVSLSSTKRKVERCPTWEEMCFVKDVFFKKGEVVIQFHPAEKDYVNNHPFCLHLWKSQDEFQPTPDSIMVGYTQTLKPSIN